MSRMPQWRVVTECRLDRHREDRWVLRAANQRYEPSVRVEITDLRIVKAREDTWFRKIREAGLIENILRDLCPEKRAVIGAGFLETRSVMREIDGDRTAVKTQKKEDKGMGEGSYKRLEAQVGRRILVCGLTPVARAEAPKTGRDPLAWLEWLASLRSKGEDPNGGVDKDVITRRDRLLTKVAKEAEAMLFAALRPVANGLMAAKLIESMGTDEEPAEEREERPAPKPARRQKMPSWAKEIAEATA